MSSAGPALIAAAAGVGLGHAVLPDHWVPLAVVGRTQRYSLRRVARLATLAGVAHVFVSLVLGAIVIAVGLQFRSSIAHAQSTIVGLILILTGVAFAAFELTGRGHSHGPDGHSHDHGPDGHAHDHGPDPHHPPDDPGGSGEQAGGVRGLAAIMIPFGAAASPDLTILPVFLAATAAGGLAAVGALVVFAAATISTIVGLTVFACFSGYQVGGQWLDRWGNAFTAGVLIVIGLLVLTGII